MHYGIAVSPGVVVAPAFCLDEALAHNDSPELSPADVTAELAKYDRACDAAAEELRVLIEKVSFDIGDREAGIFQAHLHMVRDRALAGKVKAFIVEGHLEASLAVSQAMAEYEKLFSKIEDEYLRERIVDLRDVTARLQAHLRSVHRPDPIRLDKPMIIVARELFPSQTVGLTRMQVAGIVTEQGGDTSHSAIIARSMGIPAVSGIGDLLQLVKTGDILCVDGREGCVLVNPGPEGEAAYRKLQREFFDFKDCLIENRDQPAVTADGRSIELLANINNVADAKAAVEMGAKGVGLFRTEYIFMTHPSIPDEEEQYQTYSQVLDASPNHDLTIRTLDLGGDKTVPYLGSHRESNPFMGWRSIRLSLEHPEFFKKQIRAILRAGSHGRVRMLFPMITTVEELRRANRMVWQCKEQLDRDGIDYGKVEVGIMLEVPAAAVAIEHLIDHADFVSIGTNDLVQYLMAADRDNPKVAHLCEPCSPAVLTLLKQVIDACVAREIPVTVCGEMAGRPRGVLALLAFGLRSFSMSPAFVPVVKELIHSINLSSLTDLAPEILRKRSGKQVREFLDDILRTTNQRLSILEYK